jgi:hypothetical protein
MLLRVTMPHHRPTASALLETPWFDVPRGDLPITPFSRAWTPRQRLMAAIVEDAVRSWRRSSMAPGRRAARLRNDLCAWFASDATDWPFTFVNACAHLGLSPGLVRARLDVPRAIDQAA